MDTPTIVFYDRESRVYSQKRYESVMVDFTQFFFRKRLSYLLTFVQKVTDKNNDLSLLEVGCADGIVMRRIEEKFPKIFKKMIGIDISSLMIEEAKRRNTNSSTAFFSRGQEDQYATYDLLLEVGFLSPALFKEEFPFVLKRLKRKGYFICSLPGKNSLRIRLKQNHKAGAETYLTYSEYEHVLQKHFMIIEKEACGLFIPKLWKFPKIARIIQPILELVFKSIVPNLYLEKIYLLQSKEK